MKPISLSAFCVFSERSRDVKGCRDEDGSVDVEGTGGGVATSSIEK